MSILRTIRGPDDLRRLSYAQIDELSREVREFLVDAVCRTGGHLGPNLGAVELTIALHRVFHSPDDRILWDTGHQAYVHKILTGRLTGFSRLRKAGGLSGYPSRKESVHDLIENSHASTALAYADGLAKAHRLRDTQDRSVVAVVGDGALTGGMAWEATNNIAAAKDRPVIMVINDNGRSYAPTVGGLADHLARLRASRAAPLTDPPVPGGTSGTMFDNLGIPCLGPIDGHDVAAIEGALRHAKSLARPVVVHCVTRKGQGYQPALEDEVDRLHAVRAHSGSGGSSTPSGVPWTRVFSEEMVRIGTERPDVVAITAAMLEPTGLTDFAARFPERTYDVGLAEQHAVTSAAGLAIGGMHPVVAIYSTFLNRAIDQVLLDVALHRCPVTFALDRSGVTGDDGPSHNGMWDLSILRVVPGLRIAAPRDAATLREELRESVAVDDGPTAVRFPKGTAGADLPALRRLDGVDVLRSDTHEDVLIVAVGAMVELAVAAADQLAQGGVGVSVIDPRWVKPLSPAVPKLAARHQLVATIEDNVRTGGVGCAVAQALRDAGVHVRVLDLGLPERFFDHGARAGILREAALTPDDVARAVARQYARPNIESRAEVPL